MMTQYREPLLGSVVHYTMSSGEVAPALIVGTTQDPDVVQLIVFKPGHESYASPFFVTYAPSGHAAGHWHVPATPQPRNPDTQGPWTDATNATNATPPQPEPRDVHDVVLIRDSLSDAIYIDGYLAVSGNIISVQQLATAIHERIGNSPIVLRYAHLNKRVAPPPITYPYLLSELAIEYRDGLAVIVGDLD